MKATGPPKLALRQLPPSVRTAAAEKVGGRERIARDRFSRTFAAVLAERYGGSWNVKWADADDRIGKDGS